MKSRLPFFNARLLGGLLAALLLYLTPPAAALTENGGARACASAEEAVLAWREEYLPRSETYEHGAFVYRRADGSYTVGRTYRGGRDSVVSALLRGFFADPLARLIGSYELVAFTHTHPDCPEGLHNDAPSVADVFLLRLPGIDEVYLVPYKRCEGVGELVLCTRPETWG
ncbi:MAG: DUF4329 domain-containing protein [Oscillospiraceae bacterium]|nr:DUF4329 domain-containing protein [Oscillospiraceae bacterium]